MVGENRLRGSFGAAALLCAIAAVAGCGDLPGPRPNWDGAAGGDGGETEFSSEREASTSGDTASDSEAGGGFATGLESASAGGDESGSETSAAGASGTSGDALTCGDGFVDPGEACDDGNTQPADGCEVDCSTTVGVAKFALGGNHTCAIDYAGSLRCFGANDRGQLGYGNNRNIGLVDTPFVWGRAVDLPDPVRAVALGEQHTCALTIGGEVYCWGAGDRGQLGQGTTLDYGADPGQTPGELKPVPLGGQAFAIVAGASHSCAVLAGGVRCWGAGDRGQLGLGGGFAGDVGSGVGAYGSPEDAPFVEWSTEVGGRRVFASGDNTCALSTAGTVHCWGAGDFGQLGLGAATDVGVTASPSAAGSALLGGVITDLSVGAEHVCGVSLDGRPLCWGRGSDGQLGVGSRNHIGDDESEISAHADVGAVVVQVASGAGFTCALTLDGDVRCWGLSDEGQRGTGSTASVGGDETPTESASFENVRLATRATTIATGAVHACARTTDARLRCWGRGAEGQLGQGNGATIGDEPTELPVPPVAIFRGL